MMNPYQTPNVGRFFGRYNPYFTQDTNIFTPLQLQYQLAKMRDDAISSKMPVVPPYETFHSRMPVVPPWFEHPDIIKLGQDMENDRMVDNFLKKFNKHGKKFSPKENQFKEKPAKLPPEPNRSSWNQSDYEF